MQGSRNQSQSLSYNTMLRLQHLSNPKKVAQKFYRPPYPEGRFNSNHYDERLHNKSFCPTVKGLLTFYFSCHIALRKYKYSAAGLRCKYDMNARVLEKLDADQQKPKLIKTYKEFNEIEEGEIWIIIEHCTNCKDHQASTRHIQEKYYLYARTLQKAIAMRYPMIKVTCKPIATTLEDYLKPIGHKSLIIDNDRPTTRIGAFEVVLCTKVHGECKVETLHSKIQSRVWPNLPLVLEKIAGHVPRSDILVNLYSGCEDTTKSLRGVPVTLLERFDKLGELYRKFAESLQGIDAPKERNLVNCSVDTKFVTRSSVFSLRPKSALPINSRSTAIARNIDIAKSMQSRPYGETSTKRNTSFFTSKTRPRSAVQRPRATNLRTLLTDENGTVIFSAVPVNNYTIKVHESKNFLPAEKCLNLTNKRFTQKLCKVFIELKPQTSSFLSIELVDTESQPIENATVTGILLKPEVPMEQHMIGLLPKGNVYEGKIVPGEYILITNALGYAEVNEYFVAVKGECKATFTLTKKTMNKVTIKAVDVTTGKSVKGSLIKITGIEQKVSVEGLSDVEGKVECIIEGTGMHTIQVSREGYLSYTKEICICKGSPEKISVPLIPLMEEDIDKTTVRVLLNGSPQILSLQIMCPISTCAAKYHKIGNEMVSSSQNFSETNMASLSSQGTLTLGTISSGMNEWYRVCIVCSEQLVTINKPGLDKYMRNELNKLDVTVIVAANNEVKYVIPAPEYTNEKKIWDLGFINAYNGEMMLINSMTNSMPSSRLDLCEEYFALYSLVNGKKNLSNLFGFDKGGWRQFNGDKMLDKEDFKRILSHLLKTENDVFLERVADSACNLLGHVSYNLLIKLIRLNMIGECEMEYSKSIMTPMQRTTAKKLDFAFLKFSPSTQSKY